MISEWPPVGTRENLKRWRRLKRKGDSHFSGKCLFRMTSKWGLKEHPLRTHWWRKQRKWVGQECTTPIFKTVDVKERRPSRAYYMLLLYEGEMILKLTRSPPKHMDSIEEWPIKTTTLHEWQWPKGTIDGISFPGLEIAITPRSLVRTVMTTISVAFLWWWSWRWRFLPLYRIVIVYCTMSPFIFICRFSLS